MVRCGLLHGPGMKVKINFNAQRTVRAETLCSGFLVLAVVRCGLLYRPGMEVQNNFNAQRTGTDVELSIQPLGIAFS